MNLGIRWKAYLGIRVDHCDSLVSTEAVSPRMALVYQHSPKTVYKSVYGRPFRNPSVFEQYHSGASILASAPLQPERANTFEISMERKLGSGLSAIVNVYDYQTRDLIQAAYIDAGLQQYRNADNVNSTGVEFELSGNRGDAWKPQPALRCSVL